MTDLFTHALQLCSVLIVNALIGAVVWAAVDDEQQQLFQQYLDFSQGNRWLATIVLELWPLALFLAWQIRRHR
jgi:hypothetical protein